jgi:6-phosphogluconate dehydrogenase
MNNLSSLGIIGLGTMGSALSENLMNNKISISVFNRENENEKMVVKNFIKKNKRFKFLRGYNNLFQFINSLKKPRNVILLIPPGKIIDTLIKDLIPILERNDLIIDCGNSFYKDSIKREKLLKKSKIEFLDCGISGGEEGARNGPSLMIGGNKKNFKRIFPFFKKISAKDLQKNECCAHMGGMGSGHFVKMIHNGIEYGEMQLIVETFSVLNLKYSYPEIIRFFEKLNTSIDNSFLLKSTISILKEKRSSGKYVVDEILDEAETNGTGLWASIEGLNLNQSNSIMISSLLARTLSSNKALRKKYNLERSSSKLKIDLDNIQKAFYISKCLNHYQGFQIIHKAKVDFKWNINLSEIARIWTNGCIIKSELMSEISTFLKKDEDSLKTILTFGINSNLALLSFSAAFNYWISLTSEKSNANIIQAQRDFFGNHGFRNKNTNSIVSFPWTK